MSEEESALCNVAKVDHSFVGNVIEKEQLSATEVHAHVPRKVAVEYLIFLDKRMYSIIASWHESFSLLPTFVLTAQKYLFESSLLREVLERFRLRIITELLSLSPALKKNVNKALLETMSLLDRKWFSLTKSVRESVRLFDLPLRFVVLFRSLFDTMRFQDTRMLTIIILKREVTRLTDVYIRRMAKLLLEIKRMVDVIGKQTSRMLYSELKLVPQLTFRVRKQLQETGTLSDFFIRRVNYTRVLEEVLPLRDYFSRVASFVRLLKETLQTYDVLKIGWRLVRLLSEHLSLSGKVLRSVKKSLHVSLSMTDYFSRQVVFRRVLLEEVRQLDMVTKHVNKILLQLSCLLGKVTKQTMKSLSVWLRIVPKRSSAIAKQMTEAIRTVDRITRRVVHACAVSLQISVVLLTRATFIRYYQTSISLVDRIGKQITRPISEQVTLFARMFLLTRHAISEVLRSIVVLSFAVRKAIKETSKLTPRVTTTSIKTLLEAFFVQESVRFRVSKLLVNILSIRGYIRHKVMLVKMERLQLRDIFDRSISKFLNLVERLTLVPLVIKALSKQFREHVALQETTMAYRAIVSYALVLLRPHKVKLGAVVRDLFRKVTKS